MSDNVNHPSHYNAGTIEAIEVIDDWGLDFSLGNVVKYIARAGKKDTATQLEDLRKAEWYLRHEIYRLNGCGRWLEEHDYSYGGSCSVIFTCSECGSPKTRKTDYCPSCGCMMVRVGEEDERNERDK